MTPENPPPEDYCTIPNGPKAGTAVPRLQTGCFTASGATEATVHMCYGGDKWSDTGEPCDPDADTEPGE